MKRQAGYTLLELLVVLTIMGLLIAAIPGIAQPGVSGVRFSGEVADVVARLSAAHEKAIETGTTIVLQPDDLAAPGVVSIRPSIPPEVTFFPDGSATNSILTVSYQGRRRNLKIDTIDGLVTNP